MFDLAIIGAGAAGLTAAVYAARAGLDFVVLEQDGYGGGQITSSHEVENYPGVGRVSGAELGESFRAQAEALGAKVRFGVVQRVKDGGAYKELQLEGEAPIQARSVIAATGAVPRKLGVPGEREFASYCATCDGAFYAGKDVLVIGGGDTAVEDAIYLSGICRTVTIALRRDVFRAAKLRVEKLQTLENVTILYKTQLLEITGTSRSREVLLEQEGVQRKQAIDGVFIAVGVEPVSGYLNELPLAWKDGYVVADETCRTAVPGLFVAGDLRIKPLRQVSTAVADGANAVNSAVLWLNHTE